MKNYLILLFIFVSLPIFSREGGAGDVGGTDGPGSSLPQIKVAFNNVLEKYIYPDVPYHQMNMFKPQFFLSQAGRLDEATFYHLALTPLTLEMRAIKKQTDEMTNKNSQVYYDLLAKLSRYVNSLQNKRSFYSNRFLFHDVNPCLTIDDDDDSSERVARVTSFDGDGKICISFNRLRKIPEPDLEKYILGIIIHETAHLSGLGEQEAQKVEALFYEFAHEIFTREKIQSVGFEMNTKFTLTQSIFMLDYTNFKFKKGVIERNREYINVALLDLFEVFGSLRLLNSILPKTNIYRIDDISVSFSQHLDIINSTTNTVLQGIQSRKQDLFDINGLSYSLVRDYYIPFLEQSIVSLINLNKLIFPDYVDNRTERLRMFETSNVCHPGGTCTLEVGRPVITRGRGSDTRGR